MSSRSGLRVARFVTPSVISHGCRTLVEWQQLTASEHLFDDGAADLSGDSRELLSSGSGSEIQLAEGRRECR
jgi:hypothetical protein